MTRAILRALNLPALAAIVAFVWAVCALANALAPYAPLSGAPA